MTVTLNPERLRTVHLVPLTAFDGEGRIAVDPMERLVGRLFRAGVRVFIPCAGSAEFHALLAGEIASVVALTRGVTGGEAVIVAPVGLQLGHALEVGRRSLEAGADAVMVMPPVGPYLSDAGLRDYYRQILDELEAPAIIYKKGPFPGDGLLLELVSDPLVIGVKHAGEDIDAFHRLARDAEGPVEWICGSAERYAPFFMLAGAVGYTSGAGNICPRLTLSMHEALAAGRWDEGLRLGRLIRPIEDYRARSGSSYNISFLKHAIGHLIEGFGPPRPPQRALTEEEKREIDDLLPPILEAEASLEARSSGGEAGAAEA